MYFYSVCSTIGSIKKEWKSGKNNRNSYIFTPSLTYYSSILTLFSQLKSSANVEDLVSLREILKNI